MPPTMQNNGKCPWWQRSVAAVLLCAFLAYLLVIHLVFPATVEAPPDAAVAASIPVFLAKDDESVQQRKLFASICNVPTGRQNKRILITGAAGFIGFHVAKRVQTENDVVIGVDNFNSYYPVSLKRARQKELLKLGIHVVNSDINEGSVLEELFAACQFTHVIHLAAQAGVRYAARNPMSYVNSNIVGTVTLLEVIKAQQPLPILVYASSSSIYGLTKSIPFSEEDRADTPASLYAASKRSSELLVHVYHHLYGLSVTGLRFFTVYGPWGRPDMSYMVFTKSIIAGKPIRVFQGVGNREMARDFTYIDDIVDGVEAALLTSKPSRMGEADFRLFNLGNTHPVTISDFVALLAEQLNNTANLVYTPLPALGEVMYTHANISAAETELNYSPKVALSDGLKRFVEWYVWYYGVDGHNMNLDEQVYKPD